MKNNETLDLMNVEEASAYLNLSVAKIRADIFYKRIPHFKLGRLIRFRKNELLKWLESNSVKNH